MTQTPRLWHGLCDSNGLQRPSIPELTGPILGYQAGLLNNPVSPKFSRNVILLNSSDQIVRTVHREFAAELLKDGVVQMIDHGRREIRCLRLPSYAMDDFRERIRNLKSVSESSTRLHYEETFSHGKQSFGIKRYRNGQWERWYPKLSVAGLKAQPEPKQERLQRFAMGQKMHIEVFGAPAGD